MNKHTKLVVSVLFVVIIILAAGITRFYFNVSKDTGNSSAPAEIIRKLDVDGSGNRIFEGSNSLYGVVDSNDKVIVAAEWTELSFAGDGRCVASKRIGGRTLYGGIDCEGSIVVPFIYKNISRYENGSFAFYIAEAETDGSCVVYSENFNPFFMRSWDSCSVSGDELMLFSGESKYTYSYGENGLVCTRADVAGQALEADFCLNIYSRLVLSKLDCSKLEKISDSVASYLEYAFTGDPAALAELNPAGSFSGLFPDDTKIISRRLKSIPDIFIYTERSEDGSDTYAVSIMSELEVEYYDENGVLRVLRDSCKAVVRFVPSAGGIRAVSGSFSRQEPNYPVREEQQPEETAENADPGSQNAQNSPA